MTTIRSVHHVNFIYRDLSAAVARFEALGVGPFVYEVLDARGVETARVELGGTWLVLVSPTDADSEPRRFLDEHGEGFFLLSLGVDDLDTALGSLAAHDPPVAVGPPRAGLANWRVADIDGAAANFVLQLAEQRET